jgi:hypothetical protein
LALGGAARAPLRFFLSAAIWPRCFLSELCRVPSASAGGMVEARTAFDFFDGCEPIGVAEFRQPAEAGCVSIGLASADSLPSDESVSVGGISMGLLVFLFVMAPLPLMIGTTNAAASSSHLFEGTPL